MDLSGIPEKMVDLTSKTRENDGLYQEYQRKWLTLPGRPEKMMGFNRNTRENG